MPPKHGTKAQPRCQFCHKTGHHASTCNDLAQSVLKQLRATCSRRLSSRCAAASGQVGEGLASKAALRGLTKTPCKSQRCGSAETARSQTSTPGHEGRRRHVLLLHRRALKLTSSWPHGLGVEPQVLWLRWSESRAASEVWRALSALPDQQLSFHFRAKRCFIQSSWPLLLFFIEQI